MQKITIDPFLVGHFLGEMLIFVIVAFVIFVLVKLTASMGLE